MAVRVQNKDNVLWGQHPPASKSSTTTTKPTAGGSARDARTANGRAGAEQGQRPWGQHPPASKITTSSSQGRGPWAPGANNEPARSSAWEPTRVCRDSDIYTPAYKARRPRASSQGQQHPGLQGPAPTRASSRDSDNNQEPQPPGGRTTATYNILSKHIFMHLRAQ